MNLPSEGLSIMSFPLLDSSNYSCWKLHMRTFTKSINKRAWISIKNGWFPPMIAIDSKTIPKHQEQWNDNDLKKYVWNSKAINIIFNSITHEDLSHILIALQKCNHNSLIGYCLVYLDCIYSTLV